MPASSPESDAASGRWPSCVDCRRCGGFVTHLRARRVAASFSGCPLAGRCRIDGSTVDLCEPVNTARQRSRIDGPLVAKRRTGDLASAVMTLRETRDGPHRSPANARRRTRIARRRSPRPRPASRHPCSMPPYASAPQRRHAAAPPREPSTPIGPANPYPLRARSPVAGGALLIVAGAIRADGAPSNQPWRASVATRHQLATVAQAWRGTVATRHQRVTVSRGAAGRTRRCAAQVSCGLRSLRPARRHKATRV